MSPYGRKNGKRKERIPLLPVCGEVVVDTVVCMVGLNIVHVRLK